MISSAQAKEWRGITPLYSTCKDVKRILGVTKCETTTYHLKDENVSIYFSEYPCGVRLPEGWNVPVGTVIQMTVYPAIKPKFADLHIDESKFKKEEDPELPGNFAYTDYEEGFSFVVSPSGVADNFTYFATAKDHSLRCPRTILPTRSKSGEAYYNLPMFDQYGHIPFKEEKAVLDSLVTELRVRKPTTQAYIIAYAGRRASPGEAQARAIRAKDYLVKTRGISRARIVAIDGEYQDEAIIELWIKPLGVTAPPVAPNIHPSQVQIIHARKAMVRNLKP
jgi:hypothetical protein